MTYKGENIQSVKLLLQAQFRDDKLNLALIGQHVYLIMIFSYPDE